MYRILNQILERLKFFKEERLVDENSAEYIKQNKIGFNISKTSIKFISTKKHALNYDWEFNYNEIIGIAFGEEMIIDDDEQFIIFLRKRKRPIVLIVPRTASEEMLGFENFIAKLNEVFGLEPIEWELDKVIIAYPYHLRGKELYGFWKGIIINVTSGILKIFKLEYRYSGVTRNDIRKVS